MSRACCSRFPRAGLWLVTSTGERVLYRAPTLCATLEVLFQRPANPNAFKGKMAWREAPEREGRR